MRTVREISKDGWQSSYSPDGQRIISQFNCNYETPTILNLDGSGVKTVASYGHKIHWVDNNSIVYVAIGNLYNPSDVIKYLVLDGSDPVIISSGHVEGESIYATAISPDRQWLMLGHGESLSVLHIATRKMTKLGPRLHWRETEQNWFSPDSRYVAFKANEGMKIKSLYGGSEEVVAGPISLVSWRDNQTLTIATIEHTEGRGLLQLYSLSEKRAFQTIAALDLSHSTSMVWSPNGQYLIISGKVRRGWQSWEFGLYLTGHDGRTLTKLYDEHPLAISWAPTSDRFLISQNYIREIRL